MPRPPAEAPVEHGYARRDRARRARIAVRIWTEAVDDAGASRCRTIPSQSVAAAFLLGVACRRPAYADRNEIIMDRFINNLRVLWRADSAIADIRLRHVLARSGLSAAAALIAVFGLLMLELAAYFALLQVWGAIASSRHAGPGQFRRRRIAVSDRVRTGSPVANWISPTRFTIRRCEALQADARVLQSEWAAFGNAVRHPMDSALGALPTLIVPLASVLISTLRKPKDGAK